MGPRGRKNKFPRNKPSPGREEDYPADEPWIDDSYELDEYDSMGERYYEN